LVLTDSGQFRPKFDKSNLGDDYENRNKIKENGRVEEETQ